MHIYIYAMAVSFYLTCPRGNTHTGKYRLYIYAYTYIHTYIYAMAVSFYLTFPRGNTHTGKHRLYIYIYIYMHIYIYIYMPWLFLFI